VLLTWSKFTERIWPCRSADPEWVNVFACVGDITRDILKDPPQRQQAWYLSTLAVDPAFQGKGFGSMLVAHTLQRVDEEGVPAWLIGRRDVEAFYERLGFTEKGRANVGPLAIWDGGAIMFRE
jgi:ribosomal protein S18 acetylase RimI-like enzyme